MVELHVNADGGAGATVSPRRGKTNKFESEDLEGLARAQSGFE